MSPNLPSGGSLVGDELLLVPPPPPPPFDMDDATSREETEKDFILAWTVSSSTNARAEGYLPRYDVDGLARVNESFSMPARNSSTDLPEAIECDSSSKIDDMVLLDRADEPLYSNYDDGLPIVSAWDEDVDVVASLARSSIALIAHEKRMEYSGDTSDNHDEAPSASSIPLPSHFLHSVLSCPLAQENQQCKGGNAKRKAALVGSMTASRLATHLEGALMSASCIQRANKWKPRQGDIVITSCLGCNQTFVELLIRALLSAVHYGDRLDGLAIELETLKKLECSAPWLECSATDEDPDVLVRDQFFGSENNGLKAQTRRHRLFRTTMAHSNLSVKMDSYPEARFIALFREPSEVRRTFLHHLQCFYVLCQMDLHPGTTAEEWTVQFGRNIKFGDIVNIPITQVQTTFHSDSKQYLEYEFNLRDWLDHMSGERRCGNRMMMFAEEIAAGPHKLLEDLCDFLQLENVTSKAIDMIVQELCTVPVLKTVQQQDMVSLSPSPAETGSQGEQSMDLFFQEYLSSCRGALDVASVHDSQVIASRWKDVMGKRVDSYECLFERMIKAQFPRLPSSSATSSQMHKNRKTAMRRAQAQSTLASVSITTQPKRFSFYPSSRRKKFMSDTVSSGGDNADSSASTSVVEPRQSGLEMPSVSNIRDSGTDDERDVGISSPTKPQTNHHARSESSLGENPRRNRRLTTLIGKLFS